MAKSKTSSAAKQRYNGLAITIPKGQKALVEVYARSKGETVNGIVNRLLRTELGISEAEWKRSVDPADD